MVKYAKFFVGVGCFVALLAIAAPIFFYVKDFHALPRSSDPSDWGTFGDFFGGILNPVISLLTLVVTIIIAFYISKIEKQNHEESIHQPVKPLFTIASEYFFSSNTSRVGLTLERDFYSYTFPQEPTDPNDYSYLTKQFYLKVYNRGLGIANQASVTFEMDLENLKLLQVDDPRVKITTGYLNDEDVDGRKAIVSTITSEPKYFNHKGFSKFWEKEQRWIGTINKDEEVNVTIPSTFISAFRLHNFIQRIKDRDESFPPFFVTFNYKNIHDKKLTMKFKVGFQNIQTYSHYAMYLVLVEQVG